MTKIRTKPIAQLIFGCYFFPLILSFLFENASQERDKVTFALSVSAVSLSAIVLFLTVKKWEQEWRFFIFQKKNENLENSPPFASAAEIEAKELLLKEKDDIIARMQEESEVVQLEKVSLVKEKQVLIDETHLLVKEKEMLFQAKENEQVRLASDLKSKDEEIQNAHAALLERQLHSNIQEEIIATLNQEVANLKFEMRTILKVNSKV